MIFLDPEPPAAHLPTLLDPEPWTWPTGLQDGECVTCGGRALVDVAYVGTVRCSACWAAHHLAPATGVIWPRHERRYPGGRTAPAAANRELASTGVGSSSSARPDIERSRAGAAVGAYRVLIPVSGRSTPPATASQIPAGAAALLAGAAQTGLEARPTYSLAEELATGRLVHTVAVRIAGLGYAVWSDGKFTGARLHGRAVGAREALAIVSGQQYEAPAARVAPPKGPCPRCGNPVRWRVDAAAGPVPWKHTRPSEQEGGRGLKTTCE